MVTGSLLPRPLPRAAAFSMLAGVLFLIFMASAAPSPLYRVYQGEWRVSPDTLPGRLAGDAPLLLGTLLFFRVVSDSLGPRPVRAVRPVPRPAARRPVPVCHGAAPPL